MGDALGGSMRNYVGAEAGLRLREYLLAALPKGTQVRTVTSKKDKVQLISWDSRILLFDANKKLIGNSVDVILLDSSLAVTLSDLEKIPQAYLACGELKGGIDPAGADEHWKTGRSALVRIRDTFAKHNHNPALFFVGAAIEARMAREIYDDLQGGLLSHAANLTVPKQAQDLATWLVSLQLSTRA
jgi:type II restriction enzyme